MKDILVSKRDIVKHTVADMVYFMGTTLTLFFSKMVERLIVDDTVEISVRSNTVGFVVTRLQRKRKSTSMSVSK